MFVSIDETIRDSFDAQKVHDDVVKWIEDWFNFNGHDCVAVVGISGGKDSSVVAALCIEALGKENVVGVLMPKGVQLDIGYAQALVNHLGIKAFEVNIGDAVNDIQTEIQRELGEHTLSSQSTTNLPARIRMATLYAVSQSIHGRVANTCNLSEDWVGYSTRYGDSVGDFSPLSSLTTDEVIEIGRIAGLPDALLNKVPSDGLCGKTDEDNLGFTYAVLNKYIRTGVCEDEGVKKRIDDMHQKNLFKLYPMDSFLY